MSRGNPLVGKSSLRGSEIGKQSCLVAGLLRFARNDE